MVGLCDWLEQKVERLLENCFIFHRSSGILRKRSSNVTIWWTEKDKERSVLENGGKLLEELICCSNGRCNPIRSFSAQELHNATNGFESYCYTTDFDWYNGVLDDRPILIKRYRDDTINYDRANGGPYRDIVISSLMSSHNNTLKLLGCCLEFPDPILVYEYSKHGPLNAWGGSVGPKNLLLTWKMRLKVAKDVANALTYLHRAFSRPIIHRNVKPQNVFLDENFVAKLSDFALSISIPEGETIAKDEIAGSLGFVDPIYFRTKSVTEQTDVYSFGVFLLVLVTGRNAVDLSSLENSTNICDYVSHMVKEKRFREIIDSKILEEEVGGINHEKEIEEFLGLALRCTEINREDRPLMIDVAKELHRLERSTNL